MRTQVKRWTLEEVHSLPDDGNTYELIHGELCVTPPAGDTHETLAARLARILDPYVEAQGLGLLFRPRAVFRIGREVQVEPDLMVRQPHTEPDGSWESAPLPILVVEILSPSTRRRDFTVKRAVYVDAGIAEYWIVDRDQKTVHVIRAGTELVTVSDPLTWFPTGAREPLEIDLSRVFV